VEAAYAKEQVLRQVAEVTEINTKAESTAGTDICGNKDPPEDR